MARKAPATEVVEENVVNEGVEETESASEPTKPPVKRTYVVKSTLRPETLVSVRNGFNGKLIYKSKKYGEIFVWESFGDEQDLELQELKNAKNSYKAFFENNWFLIDDPEVVEYLGIERFYKNSLSYDEFDALFERSPAEIERRVEKIPKGQKASLAYRAKQLIKEGSIDSIKVINILEKGLGVELIEK